MKKLIVSLAVALMVSLAPAAAVAAPQGGIVQPDGWCQVIPWMPMCPPMNK